jgi:2-polyprenyl-6-methoxyphenol hydroxylase-like FAD-dependent oxidoreductase
MQNLGRIAIVGGGVAGLTLAVALQRAGLDCSIYEKHPITEEGRFQKRASGFTLWSYSIARLVELGIDVQRTGSELEETQIHNQAGDLLARIPVGEMSRKLGAPSYEVRRGDLLAAIFEKLPPESFKTGYECSSVCEHANFVEIQFTNGERVQADLVIGADGIHSIVRKHVAGDIPLRYSGYSGASGVTQGSHPDLPPLTHVDVWGRGGKAGIADVGNGQIRWYLTWKGSAESEKSHEEIISRLEKWYSPVHAIVSTADKDSIVQNSYYDIPPLKEWIRGNLVLLGDAAHATTPFAAMGANMAIEDAWELATKIDEASSANEALRNFEKSRKTRTEEIVRHGRHMSRMTQLHSPIAAWLRDQAFFHMPEKEMEKVALAMASGE